LGGSGSSGGFGSGNEEEIWRHQMHIKNSMKRVIEREGKCEGKCKIVNPFPWIPRREKAGVSKRAVNKGWKQQFILVILASRSRPRHGLLHAPYFQQVSEGEVS